MLHLHTQNARFFHLQQLRNFPSQGNDLIVSAVWQFQSSALCSENVIETARALVEFELHLF